jgi:hypothetical protein
VCKTRKRHAIHLKVSGPVISLKAPKAGDRLGMMKREGVSRTFFSQWSLPVPQQLGSFNFMTTDHCENRLRFFSQCSIDVLPRFDCPRGVLAVAATAPKATITVDEQSGALEEPYHGRLLQEQSDAVH